MNKERIQELVREFLLAIGENPSREGLKDTPARVAEMCGELFLPPAVKNEYTAFETDGCGGMVLVKEINFSSVCEHHLMPFFGKAHIAYLPDQTIIGLSKLSRIVEKNARKLQIQERLTRQIACEIETAIAPKGVAVYMEAAHTCMICRGVKQASSQTVTTYFSGEMEQEGRRAEFLTTVCK